jgi:hypothetical protein
MYVLRNRKRSKLRFEPFQSREKRSEFRSKPSQKDFKKTGIPFLTLKGWYPEGLVPWHWYNPSINSSIELLVMPVSKSPVRIFLAELEARWLPIRAANLREKNIPRNRR